MNRLACTASVIILATVSIGLADDAKREWQLHDPIVLDAETPPEGARNKYLWLRPAGFFWTGDSPILAVARGIKPTRALELWRENPAGVWRKLSTVNDVDFPRAFPLKDSFGVVGYSASDDIVFRSVDATGARPATTVCGKFTRLGWVHAWNDTIALFAEGTIRSAKRTADERTSGLWLFHSPDGGLTWPRRPILVTNNSSSPDYFEALVGFEFDRSHFGTFAPDRDKALLFHRTRDAGKSWQAEPAKFRDGLEGVHRLPFAAVELSEAIGLVYLAREDKHRDGEQRRIGQHYFTHSTDQGVTWEAPVAIAPEIQTDELSYSVNAVAAGDLIVVTYFDGGAKPGEFTLRMVVSDDGGKTWKAGRLGEWYKGAAVVTAATHSPQDDRILLATGVSLHPSLAPCNFLAVQEFSPRAPSGRVPSDKERDRIASLIETIGNDNSNEAAAAERELAAFGRRARPQLREAAAASEFESKERINHLNQLLYPSCIKFDNE